MQIETKCKVCGKTFNKYIEEVDESRDSSQDVCYDCALEFITGGTAPEEGDFNTASIRSGEMSDEERRILYEDLRKVDWAACQPDAEDDPRDEEWWYE
jgi:ribosome-binding protein aMBF1 (putative translation factor)